MSDIVAVDAGNAPSSQTGTSPSGRFVPIPGKPGYRIDARGRVESERSGIVLSVDKWGRVSLKQGNKKIFAYIGDLLSDAGFSASGQDAEALAKAEARADDADRRIAMLETEMSNLKATVEKGRRANEVLLRIRDALNAEIARLQAVGASGPKKGRPATKKNFVPRMDCGATLDDFEGDL